MRRSDIKVMPEYFDRYINLVDDIELSDAFQRSIDAIEALDREAMRRLGDRAYAPGKWTIRDIFQHLIDTERIFAYRTLRFARRDDTPLPGFDENEFALHAGATRRSLSAIIDEMKALRTSSALLFASFDEEMLQQVGICWDKQISVLAMGFNVVGHQIHHLKIIEHRYLPLLSDDARV
ncbi:MAG: DinB family protein [Ignavibacteriae bacterium]|nr:DinB family protein [Ignavibacteriota bacterium]